MAQNPKILSTEIVAQSRLFNIERLHLCFANGEERYFERICGRAEGSVMIVPFLDDETFLLIREYGAGVDGYVLGFPKGALEPNEDLLMTANRELMEEVGYGANHLESIGRYSASPGYMGSVMDIVIAKDLYPKRLPGDEPEPLEVIPWKVSNIDELLKDPEFHEARSIAALLMVERNYVRRD